MFIDLISYGKWAMHFYLPGVTGWQEGQESLVLPRFLLVMFAEEEQCLWNQVNDLSVAKGLPAGAGPEEPDRNRVPQPIVARWPSRSGESTLVAV